MPDTPEPNQRFKGRGYCFIVDFVDSGEVYLRRWKDESGAVVEPMRLSIEDWSVQAGELTRAN